MGWDSRLPTEIQMGNGSLLVTFDQCGEIEQIFSPHIDALQSKIGTFKTSVLVPTEFHQHSERIPEVIPVRPEHFEIRLQLETGTQVLNIEYFHKSRPLQLFRKIALHPHDPVLMDQWRVTGEKAGLLHQSIPWIGGSTSAHCSLFHPTFNGIVHHRGRRWLGVIARSTAHFERVGHLSDHDRYRLWSGDLVEVPLSHQDLSGFPSGTVRQGWDQVVQGCTTWGAIAMGPPQGAEDDVGGILEWLIVCAESELHLGKLIQQQQRLSTRRYLQIIEGVVGRRHAPGSSVLAQINNPHIRSLCERSIDVLHSLQDSQTGALVAAAEVDPHSRLSGGYGYSWPRDGAYLGAALDAFGFHDRVEHYFKFIKETQDPSGTWWQRYLATGHAGPSWGRIQIDEPATVLSAAYLHFKTTRDHLWLESFWPTLRRGLDFLDRFHSMEDPLKGEPSHDLWEERMGFHAYSLAAVAAAFHSGSILAGELMETEAQAVYKEKGRRITSLILEKFFPENTPIRRSRIGDYWDEATDVSMLGLIRPFGILNKQHPKAVKLLDQIRSKLWHRQAGGILRYEGDTYRGGNPWVLTTLWLALVDLSVGNIAEARESFQWTVSKATALGMFAEQIHRESGKPFWVIPLGWSTLCFYSLLEMC